MLLSVWRIIAVILCVVLCVPDAQAATKVLVLGGSVPYQSGEAAFPATGVASNLQSILSGDSGVSQPVTVQAVDTYRSNSLAAVNIARTLMSWYYWPDDHAANMTLLGNGWDYVVMIDDPHVGSKFPEYHMEGVMQIAAEARKGGAKPISVMTWSSGSTALTNFSETAYRAGDGTGVAVAPAGIAWSSVAAGLKDSGIRPTARGVYVTAATVYSQIFNRSATNSTYIPSGLTQANRDSLANTAYNVVTNEATKSHYIGTRIGPTHFVSPACKKRLIEWGDYNSSTEWGIRNAFFPMLNNIALVNYYQWASPSYQSFPVVGHVIDFCEMRSYGGADTSKWQTYGTFDYMDDNGGVTMVCGVDRVMYAVPNPEQETGAANVTSTYINRGAFYVPVRVLWARVRTEHPEIPYQPDGHHMSEQLNYGISAMMYALLSGRCAVGDEPADPTSASWQDWYCRKTGYEVAWQYATLNPRVPGFEVLPRTATATNLTVLTNETLTVRFLYAPTSTVTVAVSADNPNAVIFNPAVLTFTPANYSATQTVLIRGTPGVLSNEAFNVNLATASSDGVFNGLSDQWSFNTVRSTSTVVTVVRPAAGSVNVAEDASTVINLGVAGAATNNTVVVGPLHGTWSAINFTYTPQAGYYGSDSITYYVNFGGTLTVSSVSLTVTNVYDATISLISPTNNAGYQVVAKVPLSVNGYWANGHVDYFANGVMVGSVSNQPWSMTWTNEIAGSYGVRAVAYDISGAAVTSAQANVAITNCGGMWWTTNSGVWGDGGNWLGNYVPDWGAPALFNGVDISGTVTVQLDRVRELSRLVFGDASPEQTEWLIGPDSIGTPIVDPTGPAPACWMISDGGNSLNTLNLSGAQPVIEVQNLGDRAIPAANGPDDYIAVMAVKLRTADGLVKQGPGALVLNQENEIRGGVTIQSAHGGIMVGTNGALGNGQVKMYDNTWLGCVDGAGADVTITNSILLSGTTNANYRIGPGMAANMAITGDISGKTIGSGSVLLLGGRGRGIWATGESLPAVRTANTIAGTQTFTSYGNIDIGTKTLDLLGNWPCSGGTINRVMAGRIAAGTLNYNYAAADASTTIIGGNAHVNLTGNMNFYSSINAPLYIQDQAQVGVAGLLYGYTLYIKDQAQVTAAAIYGRNSDNNPAVYFQGGTTTVKYIQTGNLNFDGGVIRAGMSTNNFLAIPAGVTVTNFMINTGGLVLDTAGYDIEIRQPLLHGTGTVDGGLRKLGSGRLSLSATNTFNGRVSVEGGTLDLGCDYALGNLGRLSVMPSAVVRLTTNNVMAASVALDLASGGSFYLTNGVSATAAALFFDGFPQVAGTWGAVGGSAVHQDVRFQGSGILTVTSVAASDGSWSTNSSGLWTVSTNWDGGAMAFGDGQTAFFTNVVTASRVVTVDTNRLIVLGNLTFGSPGAYNWTLANSSIWLTNGVVTPAIMVTANTATVSSQLLGAQGFLKLGPGTLVLTATNLIDGPVTVSSGVMRLDGTGRAGAANILPADAEIRVASNGTFEVLNAAQTLGSLEAPAGSKVSVSNSTLTLALATNTVFAGNLSGNGTLIKEGGSNFTIASSNSFSGSLLVDSGIMELAVTNSLANAAGITVGTNGTLSLMTNGAVGVRTVIDVQSAPGATGSVYLAAGVVLAVSGIMFDGVPLEGGTWGSIGSGAQHEDSRFKGPGAISIVPPPVNDGSWSANLDGSWIDTNRWRNGVVAYGADRTAYFTNTITASRAVSIDADVILSIGNIVIGSPGVCDWTIKGGLLRLTNSAGVPTVTVTANGATVTSGIDAPRGLRKDGSGTLVLQENQVTGAVTVAAGVLKIFDTPLPGGVTIASNAVLKSSGRLAGLMGEYYNVTPVPANFGSLSALNSHLAPNTPALSVLSSMAGTNFDYGSGGAGFPSPYSSGALNFEVRWTGTFQAPETGVYTFGTSSDDGSMLWIDGSLVVNNNYFQGVTQRTGTVALASGPHAIVIAYYQGTGGYGFYVDVKLPSAGSMSRLSNAMLSYDIGMTNYIGGLNGLPGSRLDSECDTVINQLSNGAFAGAITGDGAVIKQGIGRLELSGNNSLSGALVINSGAMVFTGQGAAGYCTNIHVDSGAVLDVRDRSDGTLLVTSSQILGGGGVVSGAVANTGTVMPEGAGLGVQGGAYNQSGSGALVVRLTSSNAASRLAVSGQATLDGMLSLDTTGYYPAMGNTFTVLTAAGVSGAFSSTNLPVMPNGVKLILNYTATSVVAMAVSSTADGNTNGVSDWWELQYFGSTNSAMGNANADPDHDGMKNWQEYRAHTDPLNASSVLAISDMAVKTGARLEFKWSSESGQRYRVERCNDLISGSWVVLASNIAAISPSNVYTDAPPVLNSLFYKVVLE